MAPTLKAVKEEPEEDDTQAMADPALVPPCVVLEKLEELLTKGRILLRYQSIGSKAWGVNGKLDAEWRSFKVAANSVCHFVDDTVWTTDDRDGWADGELDTLEKLQQRALQIPATSAEQPSALKPRTCRRTVFKYHKAKYAEKRMAIAKAKAKAKAEAEVVAKAKQEAEAAGAKAKQEAEAAEKAKVAAEKARADSESAAKAKAPSVLAKAKASAKVGPDAKALTKTPKAPGPVAKAMQQPIPAMTPSAFLASAKARLLEAGQKDLYKKILGAVSKNLAESDVFAMLADFPDVAESFRQLHRGVASAQTNEAPAPPPEKSKEPPTPELLAPRKPAVPSIDIEARFLRPIRERGGDAATHLVKVVFEKRFAPASLRLEALRYIRSHTTPEGSFRKLVIVRGPIACGKTKWAMEQLLLETVTLPEEEQVARSVHICAVDDFHTIFEAGKEEFRFNQDEANAAHSRNEARVNLAMKVGIHPLYVDSCNVQLWEMTPYVKMAKKFGYEIVFVDPVEVCADWENFDSLLESSGADGRPRTSKEIIEASLVHFEALSEMGEEAEKLVLACRPGVKRPGHTSRDRPTLGGKRSMSPDKEPRKAARSEEVLVKTDEGGTGAASVGTEGRIAASLLKSLIKKPS